MRKRIPKNAEYYDWDKFNIFADREGISDYPEDFMPWWECWKAGYIAAKNS